MIGRIRAAVGAGRKTFSSISRKTGFSRDEIKGVLGRQKQWGLLAAPLQDPAGRMKLGQRKGARTRSNRTLEKLLAASKEAASLSQWCRNGGISFTWLVKLRASNPIVDALALGILAKSRPLTEEERARLHAGRKALLVHLGSGRSTAKKKH